MVSLLGLSHAKPWCPAPETRRALIWKQMRSSTKPPLWERRYVFVSFRHVFSFHFLLTASNVCTFLIPSKQVVSVLKHKLVCTIMKSSAGASLLLPQSTSPPACWFLPSSPWESLLLVVWLGTGQALWSTSTYWPSWSLSGGLYPHIRWPT